MRTEIYTWFTKTDGVSDLMYSAEFWVRITLRLETAGPVAVGTREELGPVLSGKGILLPDEDPITFVLENGSRLFIISESLNRVQFTVEHIPWLEAILMSIQGGFKSLISTWLGRPAMPKPPASRPGRQVGPPDKVRVDQAGMRRPQLITNATPQNPSDGPMPTSGSPMFRKRR